MKRMIASIALLGLIGCAGKITITPPGPAGLGNNVKVIAKARDNVWSAAVPSLGKQFFVINNLDKASGFINLSYSGDPERYIDCGYYESYVSNARGERTYRFPGASANQTYEVMAAQALLFVNRRMSLEGRINLVFEEVGPNETRVSANTRYVVTRQASIRDSNGRSSNRTDTISFNSGSGSSFPPPAQGNPISCVSRGTLEAEILSLIQ